MSFVYPGFLWALGALALPVLIHLFYFRRYRKVYFTNVAFLREVKEETAVRSRLKHLLVLAARLLALFFLVLAFAQPFIPGKDSGTTAARRQVSLFVDNSFSMDALGRERSLLEEARERARLIAMSYEPDDRFQLISADMAGGQQRLLDREAFLAALDELRLSPRSPSLQQVYERQRDALARAEPGTSTAYLLSDFQRSTAALEPDTALPLNLVPLSAAEQRNLSLDSAWFEEPVQVEGQRATLYVRISNHGSIDAPRTALRVLVQEGSSQQVRALGEVDLPAGGSVTDTLSLELSGQGWQLGQVQLTDYPVTFDDTYYISFPMASDIPVLVLGGPQGNPYLNRLFGNNPIFRPDNRPADNVDYASLGGYRLIVLDGLERISSGLSAELHNYMLQGGALLVFPGENADLASYNTLLERAGTALGERVNRTREVASLNTQSPLFREVFRSVPQNLALPTATISYRIGGGPMSREDNLMRFKDGESFLGRYALGEGALYLCASPLTRQASDFPVQAGLFVPFVFRLAVLGGGNRPLAYRLGREDWIELEPGVLRSLDDQDRQPVVRLDDRLEFLPRIQRSGDRVRIQVSEQAREAGHYEIVLPDGEPAGFFALNYDRRESRMEFLSRQELEQRFEGPGVRVLSAETNRLAADVGRLSGGRRLWQACLILALLFLGVEGLLLRFL